MKSLLLVSLLALSLTACTKKPDAPAPQGIATSNPPPPGQPPSQPPPPPVTNCQGATIMYSMPVDTMPDNPVPNTKDFIIPHFELSCGDTLQVFIKNSTLPGVPWTLIHEGDNGATYYTILNQTVTVHNSMGQLIYIDIEAVLK